MGTLGLITITKNNTVLFKCVCGSMGPKPKKTIETIKKTITKTQEPLTLLLLYEICIACEFGSTYDLVIQSKDDYIDRGKEDLPPRYKEHFDEISFNPRWEYGTSDHETIINL